MMFSCSPSLRNTCITLAAMACCSFLGFVSQAVTAEERLAASSQNGNSDNVARERDRRFAAARALADQDQWSKAIRAAQEALQLQTQQHGRTEIDSVCLILQHLAVWQQLDGDYPGAVATYRQLLKMCTKGFGASHWLSRLTKVDLDECQRDAQHSAVDQRRLVEGNLHEVHAMRMHAAGKYDLARDSATKALHIREEVIKGEDGGISECLNSIGAAHLAMRKYKEAQPYFERSAAIRLRLYGLENPNTLSTLQSQSVVCMHLQKHEQTLELLKKILAGNTALYGTDNPATLAASLELAAFHMHRGNVAAAEPVMTSVLERQRATLGDKNLDVARTRMRIGQLYARARDKRAVEYLQQAATLFRELDAAVSADMASTLATLGAIQYASARYEPAEQNCKESLAIFAKTVGQRDPAAIDALACLARVYKGKGDAGQAERLLRQSLDLYVQTYGESHQRTASVLTELGGLYQHLNNPDRAQACLERALKINQAILGDSHPDTITTILTIASLHVLAARLDEAEKQIVGAVALAEKNLGPDHDATHAALFMLGNFYYVQRKYDQAEQSLRTLWTRRKLKFPDQVYSNAVVLQSLVEALLKKEDYQQAAMLGNEVLDAAEQTLPKFHSGWTEPLQSTAISYFALGRYDEARALAERAMAIYRHAHDTASVAQTEHQQIKMSVQQRGALNLYLSLPPSTVPAEAAYAHVLLCKGAIQARQVRGRRRRGAESVALTADIQRISTQLATLSLKVPDPGARAGWIEQLRQLRERKAALEAQQAHASRDSRTMDDPVVTPEGLKSILPDDTALVDLFIYSHMSFHKEGGTSHMSFHKEDGKPKRRREVRLNAFVVRASQPIQRIDLGELKPIEATVDEWRKKIRHTAKSKKETPAESLHRLVWQPLQPLLDGCKTVLFSPDGKLARLPVGALPGSQPGGYLLEDLSIAVISVPQLLPEMLGTQESGPRPAATPSSLLLIGDVDYDAGKGRSAEIGHDQHNADESSSGELITFARLSSTGPEARALANMYRKQFPHGKVTLLEQAEATEAAFRRQAPLHTWLEVATHGYYAPEGITSAMAAQNRPRDLAGNIGAEDYCDTLSGLALAGANRGATGDADDGILTAAEVSSLDLRNLDLAVLSGCETALGAISDGEGALGLQRAFQIAGARTTVSSLWTVPDGKTSQLMQRFHMNLWDKKMSKLEALREAQLWMMRTGGNPLPAGKDAAKARAAPYYWGAFIISGDWR